MQRYHLLMHAAEHQFHHHYNQLSQYMKQKTRQTICSIKGIFLLLMFCPMITLAQVGIGTNNPSASAKLQIDADPSSDAKGLLPPRISLSAANLIAPFTSTPAPGILIYNLATAGTSPDNVTPGYYYYDGSRWQRLINQAPYFIVTFDGTNPNSGASNFSGITQRSDYIYLSNTNNTQWTWNGAAYVTYTAPPSTPWYLSGGTDDAGSNKIASIYRDGKVGIGGNTQPNATLDVRSNPTSTSDPGVGYIGLGTTTETAGNAGSGALRYSTISGGVIEYSNGTSWNTLSSTVQRANVYASRLSNTRFSIFNNSGSSMNDFNIVSGPGMSNFDQTTGVYTAPRNGLYTISAGMAVNVGPSRSNTGLIHFLIIMTNPGTGIQTEVCNQSIPTNPSINGFMSFNISCSVPLLATHTLHVFMWNDSGDAAEVWLDSQHQGRYYLSVTEN